MRALQDCSTVTGANPRIVRREQEDSTSVPLNDDELAPNSANGSIPSRIAWTEPKPPGNAATVSALLAVAQLEDRNLLNASVPALPTLPPCLPPAITAKIDAVADKLQTTVNTLDAALDKAGIPDAAVDQLQAEINKFDASVDPPSA